MRNTAVEPEMPVSIASATFNLFGVDLRCHVLSDGRRIIEAESMKKLLEVIASSEDRELGDLDALRGCLQLAAHSNG